MAIGREQRGQGLQGAAEQPPPQELLVHSQYAVARPGYHTLGIVAVAGVDVLFGGMQ